MYRQLLLLWLLASFVSAESIVHNINGNLYSLTGEPLVGVQVSAHVLGSSYQGSDLRGSDITKNINGDFPSYFNIDVQGFTHEGGLPVELRVDGNKAITSDPIFFTGGGSTNYIVLTIDMEPSDITTTTTSTPSTTTSTTSTTTSTTITTSTTSTTSTSTSTTIMTTSTSTTTTSLVAPDFPSTTTTTVVSTPTPEPFEGNGDNTGNNDYKDVPAPIKETQNNRTVMDNPPVDIADVIENLDYSEYAHYIILIIVISLLLLVLLLIGAGFMFTG